MDVAWTAGTGAMAGLLVYGVTDSYGFAAAATLATIAGAALLLALALQDDASEPEIRMPAFRTGCHPTVGPRSDIDDPR